MRIMVLASVVLSLVGSACQSSANRTCWAPLVWPPPGFGPAAKLPDAGPVAGTVRATLMGVVVDSVSGSGVPQAEVWLVPINSAGEARGLGASSAADGSFKFSEIAPGQYELGARRLATHRRAVRSVILLPGWSDAVRVSLPREDSVALTCMSVH